MLGGVLRGKSDSVSASAMITHLEVLVTNCLLYTCILHVLQPFSLVPRKRVKGG